MMTTANVTLQASPKTPTWLLATLVFVFVWQVTHFFSLSLPQQVREIPDDSFFYLEIALRFWSTHEFTFDGEAPTYGFQPLWQLLMIALAAIVPTTKALFAGAFVVCAALHVGIAWQLHRLSSLCFGSTAGVVAALLWACNPTLMSWCWGLKENALYAFLLVMAWTQLVRLLRGRANPSGAAMLGAVLGIMVFTRVNSVIPAGIALGTLALAPGLGGGWRQRMRAALIAVSVAAALAAPWYLFAWFHFGTAMPTSGVFKLLLMKVHVEHIWKTPWLSLAHADYAVRLWPGYLALLFHNGYSLFRPLLIAAASIGPFLMFGNLVLSRRLAAREPAVSKQRGPVIWATLALALSAAITSFVNQMVLPNYLEYARWYAVPEFVLVAFAGGALIAACLRQRHRLVVVGGLIVLAAATWAWPPRVDWPHLQERVVFSEPPHKAQLIELGMWARDHIPEDARIGIWDPGIVSYFSTKRFVSFDPLMNSLDYLRADILDPIGYVKKRQIAYMIGVAGRMDGRWRYIPLPADGHEIVWLPYPDRSVGFGSSGNDNTVLVRPLQSPVAEFLTASDFPCGILYPNDPLRRRVITRDRDRLLSGTAKAADVVRLWLKVPAHGPALELLAGKQTVRRFEGGTSGFQGVDVRAYRGQTLSVGWPIGDAKAVVEQAHLVDYSW